MKKRIIAVFAVLNIILAGCAGDGHNNRETGASSGIDVPGEDIVKISEDNFADMVEDIYQNYESYLGRRIEFEGEYIAVMYNSEMYYQVYRNIRTECTDDHGHDYHEAKAGFRIKYEGDKPTDGSFVKVSGILETYGSEDDVKLLINADILEKCENAGKVYLYR